MSLIVAAEHGREPGVPSAIGRLIAGVSKTATTGAASRADTHCFGALFTNPQTYAATSRISRKLSRIRRNSGPGIRHMVRYVSRKGSQPLAFGYAFKLGSPPAGRRPRAS